MKKTITACLSMAVLLLAGGSVWADGAATYGAKCKMCHGAPGKIAKIDTSKSEADLKAIAISGKGAMPSYKGKLTDAELDEVVKFIKTSK